MQTSFSLVQLARSDIREADQILRACVHCGFCLATCPTYLLTGDERDSPRGRIYLIKHMLETEAPASADVATHLDRCLTCLSCMTTCPSGVHYQHLVDLGRVRVEETRRRPLFERALRRLLALVIPRPALFRLALSGAVVARPLGRLLPRGRLRAIAGLAPPRLARRSQVDRPQTFAAANTPRRRRVALATGCAQQVLNPAINEATVRLLTRHGVEVVVAEGAGCCGALVQHMGDEATARRQAACNIRAWWAETAEGGGGGLDAVIINTSGCGITIKEYGFLFRDDPELAAPAAAIAGLARDITEFMTELGLKAPTRETGQAVAYHAACSLQHGQRVRAAPKTLLAQAGFAVRDVPEAHICCGSAGTYNMLQPALAERLRARKVDNIHTTKADLVAAGNLGCMVQIAGGTDLPVVHTVELLDWATGGPQPPTLAALKGAQPAARRRPISLPASPDRAGRTGRNSR